MKKLLFIIFISCISLSFIGYKNKKERKDITKVTYVRKENDIVTNTVSIQKSENLPVNEEKESITKQEPIETKQDIRHEEDQFAEQDITEMYFWVGFYDQYHNELQREVLKYGSVPSFRGDLPYGFISWDQPVTNIRGNTYFHAICNDQLNNNSDDGSNNNSSDNQNQNNPPDNPIAPSRQIIPIEPYDCTEDPSPYLFYIYAVNGVYSQGANCNAFRFRYDESSMKYVYEERDCSSLPDFYGYEGQKWVHTDENFIPIGECTHDGHDNVTQKIILMDSLAGPRTSSNFTQERRLVDADLAIDGDGHAHLEEMTFGTHSFYVYKITESPFGDDQEYYAFALIGDYQSIMDEFTHEELINLEKMIDSSIHTSAYGLGPNAAPYGFADSWDEVEENENTKMYMFIDVMISSQVIIEQYDSHKAYYDLLIEKLEPFFIQEDTPVFDGIHLTLGTVFNYF